MRILVIHQNFPGQFAHLVQAWSQRAGWDVRGLGRETAPGLLGFNGLIRYRLARAAQKEQHPYLRQMEMATLHGQAVARELLRLRKSGFVPDVILAHPGWGETLFAKDVFPDSRLIHLCEWYYKGEGADIGFDPEFPATLDDRARVRTWNALHALNLTHCDAAISPTNWQKLQHPAEFHNKINVIHEGVDLSRLGADRSAEIKIKQDLTLRFGDPVVTYVARNLEPYRGFHIFARALELMQKKNNRFHALIVGGDDVSYGRRPVGAKNWREKMLAEVSLDPERTHFLGRIPHEKYVKVLQISAAHVYLTYPFVLSWSVMEALGCGAQIVASETSPVTEVLNTENSRLVNFFDARALSEEVLKKLDSRVCDFETQEKIAATADRYDFKAAARRYEMIL